MGKKIMLFRLLRLVALALLVTVSTLQSALAVQGGFNGGGGARIEGLFRLRAEQLIQRISQVPAAEKICAAATLNSALKSAQVRVVPSLVDPRTGSPLVEELDAWTIPGDFQLLKASWERFFPVHQNQVDRGVEKLILHELLRATGELCTDDKFEKSGAILLLLPARSEKDLQKHLKSVRSLRLRGCDGDSCYALWTQSIEAMDVLNEYVDTEISNDMKLSETTGKLARSTAGVICRGGSETAELEWHHRNNTARNRTLLRLEKLQRLAGIAKPIKCRLRSPG